MYNYKKKQVLKHNQIKKTAHVIQTNNAILTALYYSLYKQIGNNFCYKYAYLPYLINL